MEWLNRLGLDVRFWTPFYFIFWPWLFQEFLGQGNPSILFCGAKGGEYTILSVLMECHDFIEDYFNIADYINIKKGFEHIFM